MAQFTPDFQDGETADDRAAQGWWSLLKSAADSGKMPKPGSPEYASGRIEDSAVQADDLALPLAGKALAAGKGLAAFAKMKSAWPMLAASIKLKPGVVFDRYRKVMKGVNPLDLETKELGKYIRSLGPDVRTKNAELIGSQLLDQTQGKTAEEMVQRRMESFGVPKDQIPSYSKDDLGKNTLGAFVPSQNKILLNHGLETKLSEHTQHPEEYLAGTLGHEIQHALDYHKSPNSFFLPENFLPGVKSNSELSWEGFMTPGSIETLLRAAKEDPQIAAHLPGYIQDALAKGYSPKHLASFVASTPEMRSAAGNIIRIAEGNRGFRGTDPYLIDKLKTGGHFAAPIQGEMDIPVWHLVREQAGKGGEVGAWADKWPGTVKDARANYKSPAISAPEIPKKSNALPVAGAIGATAALQGDTPDDSEFGQAVQKLREFLKAGNQ